MNGEFMRIRNNNGFVKILYMLLLLLLGAIIFIYFNIKENDLTFISAKFDGKLTDILTESNISDLDVIAQSRQDMKDGSFSWVYYFRKIKVPDLKTAEIIIDELKLGSSRLGLKTATESRSDTEQVLRFYFKGKLMSELVMKLAEKTQAGKVAIVIDDVGYKKDFSGFHELGIPITYAILPMERYSKQSAALLMLSGAKYLLHLPMEPESYPKDNPGKAALFVNMSDAQIRKVFSDDIASVPGAIGVSNHMGSRFTSNEKKMQVVMQEVKKLKLFYFDSSTSRNSKCKKTAEAAGVICYTNGFFIDSVDTPDSIAKELEMILKQSLKKHSVIAIGHVQKKNLVPKLKEYIPKFKEQGIEFVYLSDLNNSSVSSPNTSDADTTGKK